MRAEGRGREAERRRKIGRKPAALLRNERKRTEEDGNLEAQPDPPKNAWGLKA